MNPAALQLRWEIYSAVSALIGTQMIPLMQPFVATFELDVG